MLEETMKALKNVKNNKSQSTDGFTSVFLFLFFKWFGNKLHILL